MKIGAVNFKGLMQTGEKTFVNTEKITYIDVGSDGIVKAGVDHSYRDTFEFPKNVKLQQVLIAYNNAAKSKEAVVDMNGKMMYNVTLA